MGLPAEQQRKDRHAGHVSFAEAQVKAGKLLPKDKETAVAMLDQMAESQPVEFSEAGVSKKVSPAEWLKGLIEKHASYTGSAQARRILDDWANSRARFVKVMPNEYRRALTELAAKKAEQLKLEAA